MPRSSAASVWTPPARVLARRGRVEGVQLASGEAIAAQTVVIGAGAWSVSLGASCGAALPLRPLRRHLIHLDVPDAPPSMPVVWRLGDEVYLRGEPGGVLASPCDEEAWPPSDPPSDVGAVELLAGKLGPLAPRLAAAPVRRVWACLRSFAPDRTPVAGADPRVRGLFWLTGLGGSGMTIGVAAGEVVAALICGRRHPLASTLTPARLEAG